MSSTLILNYLALGVFINRVLKHLKTIMVFLLLFKRPNWKSNRENQQGVCSSNQTDILTPFLRLRQRLAAQPSSLVGARSGWEKNVNIADWKITMLFSWANSLFQLGHVQWLCSKLPEGKWLELSYLGMSSNLIMI